MAVQMNKMIPLYLAQSLEELEQATSLDGQSYSTTSLLNDGQSYSTLCKRALKDIANRIATKDEELACALCIQLQRSLQSALDTATNGTGNCDANSRKWEEILSNNLTRVKEKCGPLKESLKSRYKERIAKQHNAGSLIHALFSDPRPGSSPPRSSSDLAFAASDKIVDTYLGESIKDLERYALEKGRTYLTSSSVDTCITVGARVLDAIRTFKVQGDEEMQFVLNKLLATWAQRSRENALLNVANGELDYTDKEFFKSYIDLAHEGCEPLEQSLIPRYNTKKAFKRQASYIIQRNARLENLSVTTNETTHRLTSNLSQLELHASAEMAQSTKQKSDDRTDEKLFIISSQPSTELHSSTEAPIAQALDNVDIAEQKNFGLNELDKADHALAFTDSRRVLTNAATVVAAGTDSVPVAAASLTAAEAGQEAISDCPAAIGDAALVRTEDSNANAANTQCLSLPGIAGIVNPGNDCYMASIIQILNSLPGFHEFINKMAQKESDGLASKLAAILRNLKGRTVGDLQELKKVLGTMKDGERWASNNQQDAHEFLTHLFDMLEQKAEGAPAGEADNSPPTGERRCFAKFDVSSFFKCNKCNMEPPKQESMHCVPIYFSHAADGVLNIQDSLREFTQPESVRCAKCGDFGTKKTDFRSLPKVLMLHVIRFAQRHSDGSNSRESQAVDHIKLKTAIKFPTENLDLRPLMPGASQVSQYGLYKLTGIVYHQGDNLENGHYTAHCRNLNDGLWYLFDDSTVTQSPVANESATDAYILFYSNCSITTTEVQRSDINGERQ